MEQVKQMEYVGAVKRFIAYIVDTVILTIVAFAAGVAILVSTMENGRRTMGEHEIGQIIMVLYVIIFFIYSVLMESSSKQGTLGKMIMKIKVVNSSGNKLSILNALGRQLGKIVSGLIVGIGYIMILFTKNKQGLHDKFAKTYVVAK